MATPAYLRSPPVLNRLVTVRGTRVLGNNVPKIWTFDSPGYAQLTSVTALGGNRVRLNPTPTADGNWTAFNTFSQPVPTPARSTDLEHIGYLCWSSLLTEADGVQRETPRAQIVTGISPPKIYLYDVDGNVQVEWTCVGNSYLEGISSINNLVNTHIAQIASGNVIVDASLGTESFPDGHIGFEAVKVSAQDVGDIDKRVWARLTEQGTRAGILSLAAADVSVTEVFATVITRYDVDLEVAQSVIDDAGREWVVDDAHSILDRRFMQLEITRSVSNA